MLVKYDVKSKVQQELVTKDDELTKIQVKKSQKSNY
jgi:hypothetical protein